MVHRDASGLIVFPDAQGRAEIDAYRLIALLARDYIEDEIILVGHTRDGMTLMPYDLDS